LIANLKYLGKEEVGCGGNVINVIHPGHNPNPLREVVGKASLARVYIAVSP
jgi:hypothetical protein